MRPHIDCGADTTAVTATQELAEHVAQISTLGKRVVADIIEIGRLLTICCEIVDHGGWGDWLRANFDWTDRTALNYMRIYEMATKSEKFSDLEDLPVSALYLLARPSTPAAVRDEIIERAKADERVSYADVQAAIAREKPPKTEEAVPAGEVVALRDWRTGEETVVEDGDDQAEDIEQAEDQAGELGDIEDEAEDEVDDIPQVRRGKRQSRPQRWEAAVAAASNALTTLLEFREEYRYWRDSLPENLQASAVAEKLDTICELDFEAALEIVQEAEGIDLPRGFGRD